MQCPKESSRASTQLAARRVAAYHFHPMRLILAGLFLLLIPTLVLAQATGEVESIGFNGAYRPDCWTPMVVRIKPDTAESANYEIEVWQHDLDGDRPIYTRPIVLNGSAQASEQRFWMYFLPQPIDKGLPDQSNASLRDLQRSLSVFLCTPAHKQIAQLPLTSTLSNIDPYRDSYGNKPRASKLVLAVSASGGKDPTLGSYNLPKTRGELADVEVVKARMSDLPEDPIGYEGIDAVIWLDGNPRDLSAGNLDTLAALKDYVRFGGHLVVCQSVADWQQDLGFGDMLPVEVQGIGTKSDFEPLRSMAHPRVVPDPFVSADASWSKSTGPYLMAKSSPRPGAVVNDWIQWKADGSDPSPYLARKSYGIGEVTWVAQPLTTESAPTNPTAWPYIWDQIFGWKSDAYVLPDSVSDDDPLIRNRLHQYDPAGPLDLGYPLAQRLNLSSKANWLIALAIGFFIIYGLVAGPGTYLFLATKKKQSLSWYFFGISAMVATAVTVLVVKLVLRGPPEVRHLSFVRIAPNQPAIVYSRFGLYIPRDGDQKIQLENTVPSSVSYLSPFAEHPQQLGDVSEFPSPTDYYVPVRDLKSDSLPEITVAYRSSMKKFQARWVGDWPARFAGTVKLDPDKSSMPISGTLTNSSGVDLNDVYLVFNVSGDKDWMIYIPSWPKDAAYDIQRDFSKHSFVGRDSEQLGIPGDKLILSDEIAPSRFFTDSRMHGWINYWYNHFRRGSTGADDPNVAGENDLGFVFPMLSVMDRLPAMPNTLGVSSSGKMEAGSDRVELYNRGARILNASSTIASGQLLILASAPGGLPIPVNVDDTKIQGEGTVFYQFILPMGR